MLPKTRAERVAFNQIRSGLFRTTKSGKVYCSLTGDRLDRKMNDGYYRVPLGKGLAIQSHRLLWMKRTGKRIPKGLQINHKDGNKSNNYATNHELVTNSRNTQHGWKVTGVPSSWYKKQSDNHRGEKNILAKFSDKQVLKLRDLASKGKISVFEISTRFGVTLKTAKNLLIGVTYSHLPKAIEPELLGYTPGRVGRRKM